MYFVIHDRSTEQISPITTALTAYRMRTRKDEGINFCIRSTDVFQGPLLHTVVSQARLSFRLKRGMGGAIVHEWNLVA